MSTSSSCMIADHWCKMTFFKTGPTIWFGKTLMSNPDLCCWCFKKVKSIIQAVMGDMTLWGNREKYTTKQWNGLRNTRPCIATMSHCCFFFYFFFNDDGWWRLNTLVLAEQCELFWQSKNDIFCTWDKICFSPQVQSNLFFLFWKEQYEINSIFPLCVQVVSTVYNFTVTVEGN